MFLVSERLKKNQLTTAGGEIQSLTGTLVTIAVQGKEMVTYSNAQRFIKQFMLTKDMFRPFTASVTLLLPEI